MSLAENLKRFRGEKGWTMERLAMEAGKYPQQIAGYERGMRNPQAETKIRLAAALGVTVDELTREISSVAADSHDSSRRQKIFDKFRAELAEELGVSSENIKINVEIAY